MFLHLESACGSDLAGEAVDDRDSGRNGEVVAERLELAHQFMDRCREPGDGRDCGLPEWGHFERFQRRHKFVAMLVPNRCGYIIARKLPDAVDDVFGDKFQMVLWI